MNATRREARTLPASAVCIRPGRTRRRWRVAVAPNASHERADRTPARATSARPLARHEPRRPGQNHEPQPRASQSRASADRHEPRASARATSATAIKGASAIKFPAIYS